MRVTCCALIGAAFIRSLIYSLRIEGLECEEFFFFSETWVSLQIYSHVFWDTFFSAEI